MSRGRNVVVEGIAPEDRVKPVLVMSPFTTVGGYYARPGDTLLMTPEDIAVRVDAHQVRALPGNAATPVRRFVRANHRRVIKRRLNP
jgi:hypothetical protein